MVLGVQPGTPPFRIVEIDGEVIGEAKSVTDVLEAAAAFGITVHDMDDPDGSTSFPQQLVVDSVSVTTSDSATGTAIRGLAGKCVDVAGANSADGTPVQLYDCNSTAAQQWTVGSDGTLRALGKCLDVTGNGTADGSTVQLWDCTGGPNQKWTVG